MRFKRPRFELSTLTLAILGASSSADVLAQQEAQAEQQLQAAENQTTDEVNENSDEDGVEIITVSGFRGSLLKAMNEKRFSKNVSDSIFAEDIGKSTDQNIADALSRVTGVSVQTVDGEGTQITVRGANPNQNMITLNGVQLTSADFNQAVDLSTFSADILSQITVVKTPSADHDEGSLGASVNLRTTRPLDLKQNKRTMTFQGRYNEFSEESDYKIAGTFSHKFLDDTLGFIITAYDETSSVRRDEIRVNEFQARTVAAARDQHGNLVTDYTAVGPTAVNYELFQNKRDRIGTSGTIQFLPTESTEIAFDFTYSKFTGSDVRHGVTVRDAFPERENLVEGLVHDVLLNGQEFVPSFSDPTAEWTNVNTDTRTIERRLRRFSDGGFNRRNASSDTVNNQYGLTIEQEITDNIRLELGANYSKTAQRPAPSFTVNLLSGNNPPQGRLLAGPESDPHTGIQPAGYDCTSGICAPVFGDGLITQNDPFNPFDNESRTAWNPDDIDAHNVNNFFILDSKVEDKQNTFYFDVDWDVEFAGITQIEFGAKYRKRKKVVDNQSFQVNNSAAVVTVDRFDADGNLIGQQILREGIGLSQIPARDYAFEGDFPYDNFLEDLGVPNNSLTDGWALVSAVKLQELAFANENLDLVPNPGDYRETELKDKAAYLKFNFEYIEGRLTGDLGVRYIKTDSISLGNSSATFAGDNALGRVFDPFMFRQLRDFVNNPECEIGGRPRTVNQFAGYNRIDGLGWDFTQDPPVRLPADPSGYPCFDPLTLQGGANWFLNARHEDISRHPFYVWGDDPTVREDRSQASFATAGSNTYDMFLPSVNLNYQIDEDLIGRFAASKTISRPNIDSLRPGFNLNENFWAPHDQTSGSINLFNPKLMPQESRNLDLSLEWYFNKTGLLSAAFFVKDMTNFEEEENAVVYAEDLRHVDLTQPYDVGGLILTESQVRTDLANPDLIDGVGQAACFPDRGNLTSIVQPWWFDDSDLITWCSQFDASLLRNGAGAEIKGVELAYQQNYDFLPGIWSGLGVTVNYTYQDSKTDPEFSSFDSTVQLPQFPREYTPEHSYNATLFWEKYGHQIRLAVRGKSDELVQRSFQSGSIWQEGNINLDLSSSYKFNEHVSVSFHALNLTDEETRIYYTSRSLNLGDTQVVNGETVPLLFDEGNPLEDSSVSTGRTQRLFKNGRTYRIDLRVVF